MVALLASSFSWISSWHSPEPSREFGKQTFHCYYHYGHSRCSWVPPEWICWSSSQVEREWDRSLWSRWAETWMYYTALHSCLLSPSPFYCHPPCLPSPLLCLTLMCSMKRTRHLEAGLVMITGLSIIVSTCRYLLTSLRSLSFILLSFKISNASASSNSRWVLQEL